MPRRIHLCRVAAGESALPEREAHHVRDVLRLKPLTLVEVFDDAGNLGIGTLGRVDAGEVTVVVDHVEPARAERCVSLRIASAVPKGSRADWMVEKLSELGVDAFVPLAAERSVVLPGGKNKPDRWQRLAGEAAKQSRRRGVMSVEELTPLKAAVKSALEAGEAWHLSTLAGAKGIAEMAIGPRSRALTLFIGPEGGWSAEEVGLFEQRGMSGVSLTETILRVETAAIAAAAVAAALFNRRPLP